MEESTTQMRSLSIGRNKSTIALRSRLSFLNLPIELQTLILNNLYTTRWAAKVSSVSKSPHVLFSGCSDSALRILQLRDVVSTIFHDTVLERRPLQGTLLLADNTYSKLSPDHQISQMLKAVSNGVTTLRLAKGWTSPTGTDEFKERFPKLTNIYIEGSKAIRKYWRDNGPVFARGNLCAWAIICGEYDGMFCSFMSEALDTLLPPSRCTKSQDVEIEVILVIKGYHLNRGSWSTRLGADDNLAFQFVSKGGEVRIVRKWFYATRDGSQAFITSSFWSPFARTILADKEIDLDIQPAPSRPSKVVMLD